MVDDLLRRLQQFAYAASHDLQEPLRAIIGFARLLEEHLEQQQGGSLDATTREYLDFIFGGAERLRQQLAGLLEFTRLETRAGPLESVSMRQVWDEALQGAVRSGGSDANEPTLTERAEQLGAVVQAESLPDVLGDRQQLVQLLRHLIDNALKFRAQQRRPDVRLSARPRGDQVEFVLTDNGIGIAANQRERVFQVFQRLHCPEEYEGCGMGLAVCQRIVERHGGRLWVESQEGEGSEFHFVLPAARSQNSIH